MRQKVVQYSFKLDGAILKIKKAYFRNPTAHKFKVLAEGISAIDGKQKFMKISLSLSHNFTYRTKHEQTINPKCKLIYSHDAEAEK